MPLSPNRPPSASPFAEHQAASRQATRVPAGPGWPIPGASRTPVADQSSWRAAVNRRRRRRARRDRAGDDPLRRSSHRRHFGPSRRIGFFHEFRFTEPVSLSRRSATAYSSSDSFPAHQPPRFAARFGYALHQVAALDRRRQAAGATPTILLKPRLNAASESYPTSRAIAATFADPSESSLAASCMRQCAR